MAVKLTTKKRAIGALHSSSAAHSQTSLSGKLRATGLLGKQRRQLRQTHKASGAQTTLLAEPIPVLADEDEAADKLVEEADPSDVKQLCDRYGLRREDLGRMTGFSLRALADWSAGKLPSEPAKRRLHEIRRLLDSLAEVVKPEAIAPWLKERNPAFEKMTPIQVIEVGEIDRLWQMVHHMSSDSID